MTHQILINVDAFRRALREAHCPDGWQTRAEYDDILAVLEGRFVNEAPKPTGRPRKYFTQAEIRAARRRWRRNSTLKRMKHE